VIEAVQSHYRELVTDMDHATGELSERDLAVVGGYLERIVLVSERHAEEAVASLRDDDRPEEHEPVELWA
jgi:hypothetical protein